MRYLLPIILMMLCHEASSQMYLDAWPSSGQISQNETLDIWLISTTGIQDVDEFSVSMYVHGVWIPMLWPTHSYLFDASILAYPSHISLSMKISIRDLLILLGANYVIFRIEALAPIDHQVIYRGYWT